MTFNQTHINGAIIIKQNPIPDERGYFSRIYCEKTFRENGIDISFVQSNISQNQSKGTLRGLHTSVKGCEEDKLVVCTRGRIFDVCADAREDSPTFGQYISCELSEKNGNMLFIPKGCAHGYLTMEDDCQLLYFMSEYYTQGTTKGFRYDEPFFSIAWPIFESYIISEQDTNWQFLKGKNNE
jgi:dTDP-4-dehydrorhamnose 3,5-epimerase